MSKRKTKTTKLLSARQLGIRSIVRDYLIKTMRQLEKMKEHQTKKIDGCKVNFDMGDFIRIKDVDSDNHDAAYDAAPNNCGTAACIAGWMTLLAYEDNKLKDLMRGIGYDVPKRPTVGELDNMAAVFAQIVPDHLHLLFTTDLWMTNPKDGAKKIHRFLTTKLYKLYDEEDLTS